MKKKNIIILALSVLVVLVVALTLMKQPQRYTLDEGHRLLIQAQESIDTELVRRRKLNGTELEQAIVTTKDKLAEINHNTKDKDRAFQKRYEQLFETLNNIDQERAKYDLAQANKQPEGNQGQVDEELVEYEKRVINEHTDEYKIYLRKGQELHVVGASDGALIMTLSDGSSEMDRHFHEGTGAFDTWMGDESIKTYVDGYYYLVVDYNPYTGYQVEWTAH